MNENALEWMKSAKDDLDTIAELLHNPGLTNIISFHAQQAVEKCFKAILEAKNISIQKTHNLERLYEYVRNEIPAIDEEILSIINELYIDSRYPGDLGLLPDGKPTPKEAESFYKFAEMIYEKVMTVVT